ncbi:MAG TPA: 3'-5' exonuclease [Steroidobacteraceae bacterium]|nr:3'-5' exonuclease [Steroidobacteraceae bacterium]
MNCLVFDIETVPDVELGRALHGLAGLDDAAVAKAMYTLRRQESGEEFLPLLQHRVVAISCVLRRGDALTVWSLGEPDSPEAELIERFFDGIERFTPDLISWNGGGFDLPVLHYRALKAGIRAERYWETGDQDTAFRYNNYLSRYHWRHLDLMDVLAGFQPRARAALADVAALLGFPGKLGFSGAQVWDAWQAGQSVRIRQYCETDVLNTWLIYLRFELMRGRLQPQQHAQELERVRALLAQAGEPHWQQFLQAWEAAR